MRAGETMLDYFDKDKQVEIKDDNTPVTIADKKINNMVINKIRETFPEDGVIGEEGSYGEDCKRVWVCDPIDGTAAYERGEKESVFSLALVIDGEPKMGIIFDPFTNKLYKAIKGQGAFCNGSKLVVNSNKLGKASKVGVSWWKGAKYDTRSKIDELAQKIGFETPPLTVKSIANSAMKVASGELDVVVFPGTEGCNVDMAAAKIIVEEAGGKVTNLFGESQRYDRDIDGAIISNGVVHDDFVEIFKKKE